MVKYVIVVVFFIAFVTSHVSSLTCLDCNSKTECESPGTDECGGTQTSCTAFMSVKENDYFRGCWGDDDICKDVANYDKCVQCETDKCNDIKFD